MNLPFLCSPTKKSQLSVYATTKKEIKIALIAFGLSRAKVSTDTEKQKKAFLCFK